MSENPIVKELYGIAARLSGDPDVQKNLMQEMFLHLVRVRTVDPDRPLSWYLKDCESHACEFLKSDGRARSSNGARSHEVVPIDHAHRGVDTRSFSPLVGHIEIQGELITSDVLNLILPHLSEKQQQVLVLLMKGCGVREAARELGITHPAVIKHRKKIARIARELLQGSEGVGVVVAIQDGTKENRNGGANGNGDAHAA